MLARSFLRPSRIRVAHREAFTSLAAKPARPFSQLLQPRQQQVSPSQHSPEDPQGHDGKQQRPSRGSIRPFTVLFLCIPLGYGINWYLKEQNAAQPSPDGFVKYMLASKHEVSPTCSIFSLIPGSPSTAIDTSAPDLARSITSVQFKQPQLQIARSYTLLPPVEGQDDDVLRFLIKREQKGEVSGYLHRLPLDAEVEVRGISRELIVGDGVEKVVFLAGGTGIAPAMQLTNILKDDKTDMHILWANRRREDCDGGTSDTKSVTSAGSWWSLSRLWSNDAPVKDVHQSTPTTALPKHQVVRELDAAKAAPDGSSPKLRVDYFVDEENTFIEPRHVNKLLQDATPGHKLLIVSGPEGFINYWAGPKQWLNGREVQGPIGGVLGGMNANGWEIVKL